MMMTKKQKKCRIHSTSDARYTSKGKCLHCEMDKLKPMLPPNLPRKVVFVRSPTYRPRYFISSEGFDSNNLYRLSSSESYIYNPRYRRMELFTGGVGDV